MANAAAGYDVAIIGGGPGGSTLACLLLKYAPALRIVVLERESFPRDHVGESQLPPISAVLDEMGVWDKIEAAGFPIKIGATYTWGKTTEPWVFEFLPLQLIPKHIDRPGRFQSWRKQTAFQVDRSVYDKILLDHARELGCEVRESTRVVSVQREGDRVLGLVLADGERVRARYYVDASGNAALLRRAMDVAVEVPTPLKNVAFWDYWTSERWASDPSRLATRVNVRSLSYGWLWFIALSPSRTSIGLVCNAEWYKQSGRPYEEIYREALQSEREIAREIEGAVSRGKVEATTDWSFVVERTYGENWFLVGECAGFADPILAAGLTLTQTGARELAYTILELERGELEREWLVERYDDVQIRRVRQHMRFAEFWYSANGIFEEIREHCTRIAADAGLTLTPTAAFQWLGQGGLGDDSPGQVGIGGLDVAGVKQVMQMFLGSRAKWTIDGKNHFVLSLGGSKLVWEGRLENGRIHRVPCHVRSGRRLTEVGLQALMMEILRRHSDAERVMSDLNQRLTAQLPPEHVPVAVSHAMQVLEVMANNNWVACSVKKNRPVLEISTPEEGEIIHHLRP